jgi:uncharacterized damage-inducible protein DinB
MLAQKLIGELQHEAVSTRKMLERIPNDKLDWKPHEKSMTLGLLASHVTELPGFLTKVLSSDELNFEANAYVPFNAKSAEELVKNFNEKIDSAIAALEKTNDETLKNTTWTMRNGDHIIFSVPRMGAIRGFAISHFIHHRGQLSVYLRMLDIPVPSIYGPSADESA